MEKYFITKHAVDRLIQRCPQAIKMWPKLNSWNGYSSPSIYKDVFEQIYQKSSENKSIINNTAFMVNKYWEKYGFDSEYRFFECQELRLQLVFVKSRNEKNFTLVTVAPFEGIQKINKWARTKTKEDKRNEEIISLYEAKGSFLEMGQTAFNYSQNIINVSQHIKERLFKMAKDSKSRHISKISNSTACHEAEFDGKKYEFKFYKYKDARAIEVMSVKEENLKSLRM